MDAVLPAVESPDTEDNKKQSGHYSRSRRRPAGRKTGPAPDFETFGQQLIAVVRHCFPELNKWFDALPDPRRQDLCVYLARHLWWEITLTFLLRNGSRNGFDGERNSGRLPENMARICEHDWDEERLGARRTITCSDNATHHASRVPVAAVGRILVAMVRRLMQMRLLDDARLFDRWWMVAIDGTLQDRGRNTPDNAARYRYVVEAKLVGPEGTMFALMTEFEDVSDPIRDKEDCELRAFQRLAKHLHTEFPKLAICLLMDGLYPVKCVFDLCRDYNWSFIATLKEGRQPTAWDEAVQTTLLSPSNVFQSRRETGDGIVEQTLRWTHQIPFGEHQFQVLFAGDIGPKAATLWCWVTNLRLSHERVYAIANKGGRARNAIENVFNVEKNGGFGLEHAFCANTTASQNYHLIMQVAHTLGQLLVKGLLRRLTKACRKLSNTKLILLLRTSLISVCITTEPPELGQLRFYPSG